MSTFNLSVFWGGLQNYQGYQKISKENKDDILIKECKKNVEYEEAVVALDSVTIEILRKQNEIQDEEFFDQHLMERREYIVKKLKKLEPLMSDLIYKPMPHMISLSD